MRKKVIAVNFQTNESMYDSDFEWGNQDYHYFVLEDIEVGDLVVVKVKNKYKIVRVSRILLPTEKSYADTYIVQKIDVDAYAKKQEELVEREMREHELQHLLSLENELKEYKEIIDTTTSDRLKEIAKAKVKEIENELE